MTGRIACAVLVLVSACAGGAGPATTAPESTVATGVSSSIAPTTTTVPIVATTEATRSGEVVAIDIPADGLDLAAVLTTPAGEGPFPAAVIVGGSGPVDKDGTVPGQLNMVFPAPISVYADLAAGLVGRGIATVRYDKRTCGPFNGCADNEYPTPDDDLTFARFTADAVAVTEWLIDDERFDPVFVVGHSQGGTIALVVMDQLADVEGTILLAAPYRDIDELLLEQARFSREFAALLGMANAQVDAAVAPLEDLAGAVAEIGAGTYAGPSAGGVTTEFWKSWLDASEAARQIVDESDRPVVALSGSYDWNVAPAELGLWEQAGAETGLLDCLTHAFNCVRQPDPTAITPADIGRSVDGMLVDRVAAALGR